MKILNKLVIIFFVFVACFLAGGFVFAQDLGLNYAGNLGLQDGGGQDIRDVLANIVKYLLTFLGIVAVVMVMYGGWLWMSSNGESEKINKAKKVLVAAVIGLIIVVTAFTIVTFVINLTSDQLAGTCEIGETRNCGCGGMGVQECGVSGTWDDCLGGSCGVQTCCSGGYCADDCSIPPEFYISATYPNNADVNVIRNARIRFTFNRRVDGASVDDTTFRVVDDSGNSIAGERIISGNRIIFTPDGACGDNPCGAINCFSAGENVEVTVINGGGGVLSFGGVALNCPGSGLDCVVSFSVGDLIDCEDPSVSLDFNQVCAASNNELYAVATDDSGVDNIEFFVDNFSVLDLDNPVVNSDNDSPFDTRSEVRPIYWDGSSFAVGDSINIRATVQDVDDHSANDSRNIILRPEHCCDGLLNESDGEEGVDCGGECAACAGAACGESMDDDCNATFGLDCHVNDSLCASGYCDCGGSSTDCVDAGYEEGVNNCCLCQDMPIIDWISPVGGFCRDGANNPTNTLCLSDDNCISAGLLECDTETPNGAPGNFVTIGGRFFGNTPGRILFSDVSGVPTIVALLANNPTSGNPDCGSDEDMWSNNQIIVVVPAGVNNGPIEIEEGTTGNNYTDSTDNERGPILNDFIVNNIGRPGLCLANPDSAHFDEEFNLQGIAFGGVFRDVLFGNVNDNIVASNISNWSNSSVDAEIPNVRRGETTVFVEVENINSNYLRFEVLEDIVSRPIIDYLDPASGPEGQYVTIYGSNFGYYRLGVSSVDFVDSDGNSFSADIDFPNECSDSWWFNDHIVIKVPAVDLGDYGIIVIDSSNSSSSPESFSVVGGEPGPGLCLLDPHNGTVGRSINIFGDNFGSSQGSGFVRFYNMTSATDYPFWANQNIQTSVPIGAETGPVIISNGADISNSLPFTVGNCSLNDECDVIAGEICCGAGTFWSGICRLEGDCTSGTYESGYGWTFSTTQSVGPGEPCYSGGVPGSCDISFSECDDITYPGLICEEATCTCQYESNPIDSCQGRATRLNSCDLAYCPNSPGMCSPYSGDNEQVVGTCDYDCNIFPCTDSDCDYNSSLDRCVLTGSTCDEPITIQDILGNDVFASCQEYDGNNRWVFSSSMSCPVGWTSIYNNRCVNLSETCDICSAGYICQSEECVLDQDICPGSAVCNASGECLADDSAACECCCEYNQDERDCCYPLTCEGSCGAGSADIDSDGTEELFGYCSGCASAGTTQAEHNLACNCEGHAGKYCDTSVSDGICRDCASLGNDVECSLQDACCFDYENDQCRGGTGNTEMILGDTPNISYCEYFDCEESDYTCSGPEREGEYISNDACVESCSPPGNSAGSSCFNETLGNCSLNCDTGYGCLGENGCSGGSCVGDYTSSCACCCNPDAAYDTCDDINNELSCQPNISPCSGDERGMCCGCSEDNDCAAGLPTGTGCGNDRCCHGRPTIVENLPADDEENVCRNSLISATFDQEMDITSFSGNVIVFGDYNGEVCPAGTQYLATNYDFSDKNIFVRLFSKAVYKVLNFISPKLARAYTPAEATHNYCAITGNVNGYNNSDGHGVVNFSPSRLLDPDTLYYTVIRGDRNLDSSRGVLNIWGVGMNEDATNDPAFVFNGVTYENSYIWSFRTMAETADNNGVCILDHIDIDPSSFLFQRAGQEQEFEAQPKTDRDQIISSIPGVYSWSWSWRSDNESVVGIIGGEDALISTAAAQNVRDARTYLRATATIIEDSVISPSTVGQTRVGRSQVFVFLCSNPWPPIVAGVDWLPWSDDSGNCTIDAGAEGCDYNFNYEIYYCRDAGGVGTYDDLPVIGSSGTNNAVVRGSTGFVCSDGQTSCSILGVACGDGGTCQREVLKEYYFMRADAPTASTDIVLSDYDIGGSVTVSWPDIGEGDGYRIYWGTESGSYANFEDLGPQLSWIGEDLINNTEYCFNLTSYYEDGNESEYYGEECITITDSSAPDAPTINDYATSSGEVYLAWDTIEDAISYQVYYGVTPDIYGSSQNIGNEVEVIISGLTNSTLYYFVVTAIDTEGNESGYSNVIAATPED